MSTLALAAGFVFVPLLAAGCSKSSPSTTPAKAADKLVEQGLNAESVGQSAQAVKDFEAATVQNPADTYAYYDLGVIYQTKLNEPTLATDAYQKALLANPKYQPAMFNLAIVQTPTDPQAAINTYNQLLMLNANDANVLFNLGLLLIAQNQPTPGHADLQKAIMLQPSLASRVPKGITP